MVKFSGRLTRPWPQISAMRFPPLLTAALVLAIALSFAGGLIGVIGSIFSASLLMAYGVLGFAVLHSITQGMTSRPFLLAGTYLVVLMIGWLVSALCLLGMLDTMIDVRARVCASADRLRLHESHTVTNQPGSDRGVTTMEVILLGAYRKLGQMGDVVRVKDGFCP